MKLLCYLWGMISQDVIEAAAQRLREAQVQRKPCAPVRELIGEADIDAAYAVQKVNNDLRVAQGAVVVGQKIGLTSLAVQKQLGVDQPDFGLLFADTQNRQRRKFACGVDFTTQGGSRNRLCDEIGSGG